MKRILIIYFTSIILKFYKHFDNLKTRVCYLRKTCLNCLQNTSQITLCMLGNCYYFCRLRIFSKSLFFRKFFEEYHQSGKEIYPDQKVEPSLGLNCLQNNICRRQKSTLKIEVDAKDRSRRKEKSNNPV